MYQNHFMRRIYSTLSLMLLAVLFFACQREISHVGEPDVPVIDIPTPDPITAAIQGNVFDEAGLPAPGVTVQVGSKSATTNANGYFRINNAALDKKAALVTAVKAGYFKAYRVFGATSGANNVEIKLVKKVLAGTINATAGGEVSLTNGSKVALPANGVVNAATSAAYTGTVNVYAAYIDPSASDISQTVPGSFMANDKDGRRVTLTSYGMIAVELESAAGEKLQIKSGSNATLTTAIPSSTQASAPAIIALWSVDETTGIWKEEGTATKSGNVYVGNVSHFSFWNCDVSANAVVLSMTLKNTDGAPLVRAHVILKIAGTTWSVSGWTDSLGQVSGYIPYNRALVMEVVDQCNTAFYTQNIGPYTVNTNLGVITITPSTSNSIVTVKGKLLDCSSNPVTNGYALVSFGYYTHYASVNATGDFQTTFTRCGTSPANFSILGVDAAAQQQSTVATSVAVVTPITNAGNISACGTSSSQFITYTLDGTAYSLVSPADSITGFTSGQGTTQYFTSISAFTINSSPNQISFSFQSPTQAAGSYALSFIRVNNLDSNIIATPINVTITSFPTVSAGFYDGSFSGQFTTNGTPHTISATFRVRRR
jgi:hypothetical protein